MILTQFSTECIQQKLILITHNLGKQQCSTVEHFEIFLDTIQQFSHGNLTLNDYLRKANCLPLNCKLDTWNHMVMFEESHKDFIDSSDSSDLPDAYFLTYYMRTHPGPSEVILFLFISYEIDQGYRNY